MDSRTKALCDFLNAAHSVYHAQAYLAETLKNAGYTRLYEQDEWALAPGGKYFLTRGGSALVAFRVPQGSPKGFLMSASHSDRPTFKVKENFELAAAYTRMAVERYGGMLISPWLDRPLSVAGRVTVETEAGVETKLLDIDRDLLLIPNVAIHMNRQANEGYKWNPAVDTLPLIGSAGTAGKLPALLETEAGGKILGHDLYLYIRQKASVWGVDEEYISSAALDDLECAWGCTQGFLKGGDSASIPVLCVFDSEEVGSVSAGGYAGQNLRRPEAEPWADAGAVFSGVRGQCPCRPPQPPGVCRPRQRPGHGRRTGDQVQRQSQLLHRQRQRRSVPENLRQGGRQGADLPQPG